MATGEHESSRAYGAIGCLTVFFLPAALLSSYLDATLAWPRAAAYLALAALLMAVPLLFAGHSHTDE